MNIVYGKCERISAPRVTVRIPGFSGDAVFECLLMQPCVSGPSAWVPSAVGDVVVIALDEERLENSVVLGSVYPDAKNPPKAGQNQAAFEFSEVYLGNPTPDTKLPRDDKIQAELNAIKSELDAIKSAFSEHTHSLPPMQAGTYSVAVLPTGEGPGNTGASPAYAQGYAVGDTASECVWGR